MSRRRKRGRVTWREQLRGLVEFFVIAVFTALFWAMILFVPPRDAARRIHLHRSPPGQSVNAPHWNRPFVTYGWIGSDDASAAIMNPGIFAFSSMSFGSTNGVEKFKWTVSGIDPYIEPLDPMKQNAHILERRDSSLESPLAGVLRLDSSLSPVSPALKIEKAPLPQVSSRYWMVTPDAKLRDRGFSLASPFAENGTTLVAGSVTIQLEIRPSGEVGTVVFLSPNTVSQSDAYAIERAIRATSFGPAATPVSGRVTIDYVR